LIDGAISTNCSGISKNIVHFYKKFFTDNAVLDLWWMVFILILLIRLMPVGWREFEEMEVWEVVKARMITRRRALRFLYGFLLNFLGSYERGHLEGLF
jgi:hypothetical protein